MRILLVAMLAAMVSAPAAALTYTDADYRGAYQALNGLETVSLMSFGDATTSSDIGGRAWIGGKFTSNSAPVNSGAVANGGTATLKASSTFVALTAGSLGSNATINNGTNLSPHDAVVGSLAGNRVVMNGAGTVATGNASTIAGQAATYQADAAMLSGILGSQPSTTISNLNAALALTSGTYNMFTMSGALFGTRNANFDTLFANLNSSTSIVINVAGCTSGSGASCTVAMDGGTNFNGNVGQALLASNVIWNFTDAAQLTLRNFFGSVLAPGASVGISAGNINGSVMASAFTGGGEIHLGNYAGSEGFIPPQDRTSAVPEPTSWATMLVGFGAIGLTRRRRKGQSAPA